MRLTYLIGAGASVGAIPIVNELLPNISSFIAEFKSLVTNYEISPIPNNIQIIKSPSELLDEMEEDVKWLLSEAFKYSTIDTLAKKLFLRNEIDDYNRLKSILNIYLGFRQSTNSLDKRYDNFFATILKADNGRAKLPKKVCVLSWNYDIQFELSLSKFLGKPIHQLLAEDIQLIQPNSPLDNFDSDKFTIIKLNGSATYQQHQSSTLSEFLSDVTNLQNLKNRRVLLDYILLKGNQLSNNLSFAWEDRNNLDYLSEKVKSILEETYVLTVIGYSFPTFNREIDLKMFRKKFNRSGKIVIQNPDAINQVDLVSEVINKPQHPILTDLNKNYFYIPIDFNLVY